MGAFITGKVFNKFKIPGAMMIGAMLFTILYMNTTSTVINPNINLGYISQILAGICIGGKVTRLDLFNIKKLLKEIVIINLGLLITSLVIGFVLFGFLGVDPYDAFFGSIPGGMTSIPVIAMEHGANPVNVTLLQFARLIVGIGIFPKLISKRLNLRKQVNESKVEVKNIPKKQSIKEWQKTVITIGINSLLIVLINRLNLPINILIISIIVSSLYNIVTGKAHINQEVFGVAQLLLGLYIGSLVKVNDLIALKELIIPLVFVAIIVSIGSVLLGQVVNKYTKLTEVESYFSAIPAGAADIGLIIEELNVFSSNVIIIQVARVLIVTILFPPIMNFVISLIV